MKSVLIVEDDVLLVQALQDTLVEKYTVRVAHNGRDGLAQIEEAAPDLILLDLMMPDMGGIEMLTELQKIPGHENIKVTVLTNANDMEMVTAVMEKGGYHYFVKGDTPLETIAQHVDDMLGT